jgi:hypothetical protein
MQAYSSSRRRARSAPFALQNAVPEDAPILAAAIAAASAVVDAHRRSVDGWELVTYSNSAGDTYAGATTATRSHRHRIVTVVSVLVASCLSEWVGQADRTVEHMPVAVE